MSIFSKFRSFLYRHRNKFLIGGLLIGGSVFLTRYAQQRLREWQEKEAREFIERTRKQQHFESTERTCNQTILNLSGHLHDSVSSAINADNVVAELRGNPDNKLELWERLKILVFTRISCIIYASVMLVVLLRIQLNVIGGYLFKNPSEITSEFQQEYLMVCNKWLETGVQKLSTLLEKECQKIVGVLPLKRQLKISDLENIFWAIQNAVRDSPENPMGNFSQYVFGEDANKKPGMFEKIIDETADLLDSEEVKAIASSCINRGFVILFDQLSEFFRPDIEACLSKDSKQTSNGFIHPSNMYIALAKLIPIFNGLSAKTGLPGSLIQQFIINDKLKILGANIYESFSS